MIIKNEVLARIVKLRKAKKALAEELAAAEEAVLDALLEGSAVERGRYEARIDNAERRNVPWRKIVERLKGKGYAERVLKNTKPDVTPQLTISLAGAQSITVAAGQAESRVVARQHRRVA